MMGLGHLPLTSALIWLGTFVIPVLACAATEPLVGKKLLLKEGQGKAGKRALVVLSKDPSISLGDGNGSADDPVLHGGTLRITSAAGDGFDTIFELPGNRWRYKGRDGRGKGYELRATVPIRSIVVRPGKVIRVVAKGAGLEHSLGTHPESVRAVLTLGGHTYCMTFGGTVRFKAGKRYLARMAPPPASCSQAGFSTTCGNGSHEEGEVCAQLEGAPGSPAIDATRFHDEGGFPNPDEIVADVEGREIVRTQLEVGFVTDATTAGVNALLQARGARIASMLEGVPILGLHLPDPGSLERLEEIVAGLEADPIVRFVRRAVLPGRNVLPDPLDAPPVLDDPLQNLQFFDHHIPVRGPAAWNARRLLPAVSRATVIVADFFGGGRVGPAFDVMDVESDYGKSRFEDHGYHVLGVIAAAFDRVAISNNGAQMAAGIYPGTVNLRVVDGQPQHRVENQTLIRVVETAAPAAILNTSIGFLCDRAGLAAANCNEAHAVQEARVWIEKVRGARLEDRFLHVTSAGNIEGTFDPPPAEWSSEFAAAALLPQELLTGLAADAIPPLSNTLVVENIQKSAMQPFTPECLNPGSKVGGQIGAIGTDVWSTNAADGGTGANKAGTSQAAPQVAGVAALVWSLAPGLSVANLKELLLATTQQTTGKSCAGAASAPPPVLDAYAAILATDGTTLDPMSAPVRHALLDVNNDGAGDGTFDDSDLFLSLAEYFSGYVSARNPGTPKDPNNPDYSRYDLNGDGFTGGTRTRPFDLDRGGSTQYGASKLGTVTATIEGTTVAFDETALTDLEILCYYAYSPLYQGDLATRTERLGTLCDPCAEASSLRSEIRMLQAPGARGADQCQVVGEVVFRESSCTFNLGAGAQVGNQFCNDGGGFGGSRQPMPFSDSDDAACGVAVPGVGAGSGSVQAANDSAYLEDSAGKRIGITFNALATAAGELTLEGEPNPNFFGDAQGTAGCNVIFDVANGAVGYTVRGEVASTSSGVGSTYTHYGFVQLPGTPLVVVDDGSVAGQGVLQPGRYVTHFDLRASASAGRSSSEGDAEATIRLNLEFGRP